MLAHSSSEGEEVTNGTEFLQFDFGTIRNATDNFSEANKLGQGGFGAVYKVMKDIVPPGINYM